MNDVGPNSHMHGHRQAQLHSRREKTRTPVRKLFGMRGDIATYGFANPQTLLPSCDNRFIQNTARVFCHSKPSGINFGFDFFRRVSLIS